LLAVLIIPLALAVRQFLRNRKEHRWAIADTALVIAAAFTLFLPFVPPDLNGSHFFAERLLLLVWVFALVAGSGVPVGKHMRVALLVFTVIAQGVVLHAANSSLRPAAESMATIENAKAPIASPAGRLGLLLEDPHPFDVPPGLSFDPYLWGAVNVFRHDNSVLANTPWLDLPIIPLGATPQLPAASMKPDGLEFPSIFREELAADPAERETLLNSVDFLVIGQANPRSATDLDPVLGPKDASLWVCKSANPTWLRLCEKVPSGLR
jgi:hypothetical protein